MKHEITESQLEKDNNDLTKWGYQHPGCRDEIDEYQESIEKLRELAGNDDEADHVLLTVNARCWKRWLTGK